MKKYLKQILVQYLTLVYGPQETLEEASKE